MRRRGAARRGALLQRALLLPQLCRALHPWSDGTWYDTPQDFNVGTPICKLKAEALQPWCPSKWHYFNGSCWLAVDQECEFQGAVELCREAHMATLASISSAQENEVVRGLCGDRMCWLGLGERKGLQDAFEWMDGAPATYFNWHKGEPSNFHGVDENVVIMNFGWKQYSKLERRGGWASGDWFEIAGSFNKPVPLCERSPVTGKAAHCTDGWDENADSCYQLLDWNCTYEEAIAACLSQDAHLVSISSEKEQLFVKSLCGPRMCWLGMAQDPNSKAWTWLDGTSMAFANWARGEPDDKGGHGHQHRAMMNLDVGWLHGKNARWRNSQRKKVRAAFRSNLLMMEEHVATKFRIGSMALFTVAYMAAYIVRQHFGVRVPGGPLAAVSAALFVVFSGGLLDFFLWRHPGLALGLLVAVGAAEGLYIGGTRTGLFKPVGRSSDADDARTPAMGGVLE